MQSASCAASTTDRTTGQGVTRRGVVFGGGGFAAAALLTACGQTAPHAQDQPAVAKATKPV
ncbi:MAG: hypothetical protein ACRDI2_15145, partial [Chloroflexota bacterium]